MNARIMSWSSVMAALAMSLALPATAQEGTGDPFLDAMLGDQNKTQPSAQPAETPAAQQAAPQSETKPQQAAPQQARPRLVNVAADTGLVDNSVVQRELGEGTGLFGDDQYYTGKTVNNVRIHYVSGTPTVPDARLLDLIRTKKGAKYSPSEVNDDLERLINRGLVDGDARVAVEPSGGGVSVIFEVRPASVMGGVGFTGNKRFTAQKIRDELKDLHTNSVINDHSLAAAKAAIIKMYYEAGYPDTKVTWRHVGTARSGYNDIIFDIDEGREVSLYKVTFSGNHQFDSNQLRRQMKTEEHGIFSFITDSGRIDRQQLDDDLQEIIHLYRNYGYLRARIVKVEYSDNGKKEGLQKLYMHVQIEEGPRYRVRHVSFSDLSVYTPKDLEKGLSMLDGDIYSLRKVKDDITMIRSYYGAKGYADADVRPDIDEVGVDSNGVRLVDIHYRVHEGSPYRVGRVNVRGNTITKSHVILRELPVKPGQPLNSVDLETAHKRLKNLGYFGDAISVTQTASDTPGFRDVNVNVQDQRTGTLYVGLSFSSIDSLALNVNITQSNFDIRGLFGGGSFRGGGQRFSINSRIGTKTQTVSVFLQEPWFLDQKLALGNELFFSHSSYLSDFYDQRNYGWEISLRKALNEANSLKLAYRLERYDMTAHRYAPEFFQEHCGVYDRSSVRLSYSYDSRDAMITPRKGSSLDASVAYSGPGSTVQTYGVSLGGSTYYNTFWDTIFSLTFGIDTVDTIASDKEVPLFERCYLGGPNDMRGFRYHDVGLVDREIAGNETMGGNTSAYLQAEMTVPVFEAMRFAAFVDVGFVNKESFDFKTNMISADYGFGLRLNLPIGPLAIDYAIPFKTGNAINRHGQFQFYVDYKY